MDDFAALVRHKYQTIVTKHTAQVLHVVRLFKRCAEESTKRGESRDIWRIIEIGVEHGIHSVQE